MFRMLSQVDLKVRCCLWVCPVGRGVFGGLSHVVGTVVSVIGSNKGYIGGQWVGLGVLEREVSAQ